MTATRNRDRHTFSRGRTHELGQFFLGARPQKFSNARAIELRMDVIDPNLFFAFGLDTRREREKRRCPNEFATRQHCERVNGPVRFRRGKLLRRWRYTRY